VAVNLLGVGPRPEEVDADRPGDDIIAAPDVVLDRAFTLPVTQDKVWPWIAQLGKGRAGWYLPRSVELLVPRNRRSLRRIDPALQQLQPGDVIGDWGGRNATLQTVRHDPPDLVLYRSTRGDLQLTWMILLRTELSGGTRVHLRLRMAGVKRRRAAQVGGGLLDLLSVAGLAAGLRERLTAPPD